MATLIPGQVVDILARAKFDEIIGAEETSLVDFKLAPYALGQDSQKWELAKDVAAFCNRSGGLILIGLETSRLANETIERVADVRLVRKSIVELRQYQGVIDSWIYPRPRSIDIRWYPPEPTAENGVLAIEVPPQDTTLRPFIVRDMREPGASFKGAIGIPSRDGDRIVWDKAEDLHRQLLRGASVLQPVVTRAANDQRASDIVNEAEEIQSWQQLPVMFLQMIPADGTQDLDALYDEIQDGIVDHRVLRASGFYRRRGHDVEIRNGALINRKDENLVWIEPDGLTTQGVLIAVDTALGWYYNQRWQEGERILVHPTALVEITLEFFRLWKRLVGVRSTSATWRFRLSCRRLQSRRIELGDFQEDLFNVLGGMRPASADQWTREFTATGEPVRDSFEALKLFYALFGKPPAAIPLADNNRISEQLLVSLRG